MGYRVQPGDVYGRLTVLERAGTHVYPNGETSPIFLCQCSCPNHTLVKINAKSLKRGSTKSCGCLSLENIKGLAEKYNKIHGRSNNRLSKIYRQMIRRCTNPKDMFYEKYGKRGISICKEWYNPEDPYDEECFRNFWNWAMTHGYVDNLSIERRDVNGPYSSENCIWRNNRDQQNNKLYNVRAEYDGQNFTIGQWAYIFGVDVNWLRYHIAANYQNNMYAFLNDWKGKIPMNAIYFIDQYGYPKNEADYTDPPMIPCLWNIDNRGYITSPVL